MKKMLYVLAIVGLTMNLATAQKRTVSIENTPYEFVDDAILLDAQNYFNTPAVITTNHISEQSTSTSKVGKWKIRKTGSRGRLGTRTSQRTSTGTIEYTVNGLPFTLNASYDTWDAISSTNSNVVTQYSEYWRGSIPNTTAEMEGYMSINIDRSDGTAYMNIEFDLWGIEDARAGVASGTLIRERAPIAFWHRGRVSGFNFNQTTREWTISMPPTEMELIVQDWSRAQIVDGELANPPRETSRTVMQFNISGVLEDDVFD